MAYSVLEPKQLKRIRVQLGLTQARLANEAGVSQSLIAKIEAGRVDPTFSSMKEISEALRSRRSKTFRQASEIMSKPVVTIQAGAKLSEGISTLKERGISQLPVLDGSRHVGTLTEGRILEVLATGRTRPGFLDERVGKFMGPALPVVSGDTPTDALLSLFAHFPAVLVSAGENIQGIIAKIDLLAAETEGRPRSDRS